MDKIAPLSPAARSVDGVTKIKITSPEQWHGLRKTFVGASEISALFGVHPYLTAAQLFETKSGRYAPEFSKAVVEDDEIILPPTERGLLFEAPALSLVPRIHPDWRVESNSTPGGYYFTDRTHGLATTPDAFVYAPSENGPGAIQIKSVAEMVYGKDWFDGGMPTVPLAHAVQATVDAALSGCTWALVGVLVAGFTTRFRLFRIEVRPQLVARARALAAEFWRRIEANEPYPFDYARDGELIAALYGDDDGSMVTLDADKAARMADIVADRAYFKDIEAQGADAAKSRKALDAEVIALLGNGTGTVLDDGRVLTAKTTRRGAYSVEPTSFRTVRIASADKGSGRKSRAQPALAGGSMQQSF